MIDHQIFRTEYERFWSLDPEERNNADGGLVALMFVMLALGTQFAAMIPSFDEKEQQAEFWGKPFPSI